MKRAIVIRHVPFEDLGTLTEALEQQNYQVTYMEAVPGFLEEMEPNAPDLVVILGGPIGVYDEADYPFVSDELKLLENRLAANLPTLGICLGAQLIARALGAKVYPGPEKEIGWSPLILTEAGKQSPLKYLAGEHAAVLHWHGDTFELPVGATHLAKSDKYVNQAFTWGDSALALQFHPEVTAQGLERWFIGHACEIGSTPGVTVNQLRQDTTRYSRNLAVQATQFWQAWLTSLPNV